MKFPLATRPFRGVRATEQQCREYASVTRDVLAATLNEYDDFVLRDGRIMDKKLWKPVKNREDVAVYKQIARQAPPPQTPTRTRQPAEQHSWRLPKLVAVGTIVGMLDDVMYGIVTPDAPSIVVKTSYVNDELLDSAVLHTMERATAADPFRFLGLKWLAMGHSAAMSTVVWPRDFVFIESTGVKTQPDGDRIGFHVMHSVDHPECGDLEAEMSIIRSRFSSCYLYRQRSPGVVEIYMMAHGDPGGNPPETIAVSSAATSLMGVWKSMWCAQNKKLSWLLENGAARRRFRATAGPTTRGESAQEKGCCYLCLKTFRSFRTVTSCHLCSAWVCSKCRVARKLSTSNDTLELTQRVVEVCKSCVTRVANEDASRIAREQYVPLSVEETPEMETARSTKTLENIRPRDNSDESTATLSDSLSNWSRFHDDDSDQEQSARGAVEAEAVVETIDDWARQSRYLASSVYRPLGSSMARMNTAVESVDHEQNLLLQMQTLCQAAEETYQITSLTASRILDKPRRFEENNECR